MADNLAHDYALGIWEDLHALESLIIFSEDLELAKENLEPEEFERVQKFVSNYGDYREDFDSFSEVYFDDVLEIKRTYSGTDNSAENLREVAVVVTIGGPHAEILFNGSDFATVEVFWGGDRVSMSGEFPNIVEHVWNLVSEVWA